MSGPIKWVVLTGTGAHIIQQLQPVDLLRQLLVDGQGPDCTQVKAFFQVFNENNAIILIIKFELTIFSTQSSCRCNVTIKHVHLV